MLTACTKAHQVNTMPIKPNSVQVANLFLGPKYQPLWGSLIRLINVSYLQTVTTSHPQLMNVREFHCIRGNDLDRLEKEDFTSILKWLKCGVLEVARKIPQPHQTEAINDILNALED